MSNEQKERRSVFLFHACFLFCCRDFSPLFSRDVAPCDGVNVGFAVSVCTGALVDDEVVKLHVH